jgi:RimJ/RimL family protein N-acetyltransferase
LTSFSHRSSNIMFITTMELKEHNYILHGQRVVLRPMTEDDWQVLARWETDPEVIYWADSDPKETRTLEEVQHIFRAVSQTAYCFVVEVENIPIGSCWLQRINMEEILKNIPIRIADVSTSPWEKNRGGRALGLMSYAR